MAISQSQLSQFNDWLRSHAAYDFKCPVCEKKNFNVEGPAIANQFDNGNISMGSGIPLVYLVCNECGLILPFSAKMTGVL